MAIAVYVGVSITHYAKQFTDRPSDVAIVLGAAIWQDKPSPVFQARIDHAVNLHQQGKVTYLIFTGGVGAGETLAESEVARNYAVAQGVALSDIFIETQSKITFENLVEAKALLDSHQLERVLIVSDPLHMKRAMTMAHDLKIKAASSPTPTSLYRSWRKKLDFLSREVFYYLGYLIFR